MNEVNKLFKLGLVVFLFLTAQLECKILSMGNQNAKVTVKVFSSLTCPHCANFHEEIFNKLINKIGLEFDLTENNMNKCLNSSEAQDEILNQRIEAQKKYKIDTTPTIIINEKKYIDRVDYKSFKKIIEKNL